MVLKGVSDSSTEHIQKLVSNQKIDKKKKWGVLGGSSSNRGRSSRGGRGGRSGYSNRYGGGGYRDTPKYQHPHSANYQGRNYGHQYERYTVPPRLASQGWGSSGQAKHRTVAQVPSHIRDQIHDLVSSYQENGLPLTHISQIFRQRYGVPLEPWALGFVDEADMISSLRDIVAIKRLAGDELRVVSLHPGGSCRESNVWDSYGIKTTKTTPSSRNDTWNNISETNRSNSNSRVPPLLPTPGNEPPRWNSASRHQVSVDQFKGRGPVKSHTDSGVGSSLLSNSSLNKGRSLQSEAKVVPGEFIEILPE